ncbi:hypothetical protein RhiJN_25469 [Ceratobasidium sp. AG-Ba]|nr:hypothetical protein RhiJN_25469 [Ceratobasidium sp. AG-Ba]
MAYQRFYDIQLLDAVSGVPKASQIRIDYRHLEGALAINLVVRNVRGVFVPVPCKAGALPFDVIVFNSPKGVKPAHITQDENTGSFFHQVTVGLFSPIGIWIRKDISNLKFGPSSPTPPGWHISDRHVLILKPQEKLLGLGNTAAPET